MVERDKIYMRNNIISKNLKLNGLIDILMKNT